MTFQKALTYMRNGGKAVISCVSNKRYTFKKIQEGKSISYQTLHEGVVTSPTVEERLGEWKMDIDSL